VEELVLTDPVVVPEVVTNKFRVTSLTLDYESLAGPIVVPPAVPESGLVLVNLKDNNGKIVSHSYTGKVATDMMKWMNTADFSVNSMHKRILQKLSADGILPGTVTGTPDPPTGVGLEKVDN